MTRRPTPSSGRLLFFGLVVLLTGAVLLLRGGGATPVRDDAPPAVARVHRAEGVEVASRTVVTTTPTIDPSAGPELPPRDQPVSGDGPSGDHAVQRLLDRTTPTDLPPTTARHLTRLATSVWLAETTGVGRAAWPAYFTGSGLRAPYDEVRVQAAVAHQRGQPSGRAEVRLVWAGADAAGEFRDGRTGRVLLEFHRKEWEPIR